MRLGHLVAGAGLALVACGAAAAATYDPTTDFASGWIAGNNPQGVWSYGSSGAGFTGPVTLYSGRTAGADSPNQLFWIGPSNCCAASPAVGFNNGPAFDDGNVAQAADQIDMVSSVFQNLVTDLVFTAPVAGKYALTSSFVGDQRGIGVNVAVLKNSNVLFSSSVTSFGQIVPFDTVLNLAKGDTVAFAVQQGAGLQNTGLNVSLSAVPEPATWAAMLVGLCALGAMARRRRTGLAGGVWPPAPGILR